MSLAAPARIARSQVPSDTSREQLIQETERPASAQDNLGPIIALRTRYVKIDVERLVALVDSQNPVLVLDLFSDVVVTISTPTAQYHADGFGLSGPVVVDGKESGTAALTVSADHLFATLIDGDAVYNIDYAGEGIHVVRELDEGSLPKGEAPEIPPPTVKDALPTLQTTPSVSAGGGPAAALASGPPVLDVLVLHTPQAGAPPIDIALRANQAIADTNTAYQNSGISQRVRLVGLRGVSYSSTNVILDDLVRLRDNTDPFMSEIHGWRDTLGADLVLLYGTGYTGAGSCGIGYIQGAVAPSFELFAFSVVDINPGCAANFTPAHELGHNMAARHDWAVDSVNNSPFTYNHGYVDTARDFNTVMAYSSSSCPGGSCTPIQYFSNPDVAYSGGPTGVPEGQFQAADNRKTLNNTASNVDIFRGPRVGVINACNGGYVKDGSLANGFQQQLSCGDAKLVTVGGSRVGVMNSCNAAYVKEGALSSSFNSLLNCGDARTVALSPERVGVINGCGSAYVKEGQLTGPFHQQLNCNDARAITVGGSTLTQSRLGVINGCGAAYVKLGALTNSFNLLLNCNDALAIVVTDNRVGVINSCGAFYVKEGALSNPFQLQTGCGDTRAIDLSGNRIAVINGCGSLYVKDGTVSAPFQQQTGCNDAIAVDLEGNRVGLISGCGGAWVKEGALSGGFTPQLNCGDGKSVSVVAF